jgi:hypothetical protein
VHYRKKASKFSKGGNWMKRRLRLEVIFVLILFYISIPTPISANSIGRQILSPTDLKPSNTVILSNQSDARFSRDFSVLLKNLRLDWMIVDSTVVPDSIKHKNLILLGHPDSEFTGQVMREMLSDEEVETLLNEKDSHMILDKENFWMDDRIIYICSGSDFLQRRNAAEVLVRSMIANAPPASDWLKNTYEFDLDTSVREEVVALQYQLSTPELSIQEMVIDVNAKPPRRISADQAAVDVERLFYLFSHGYSGYAVFNQNGEFEEAKENILQEISSKSSWSDDGFAALLHEHLSFIVDFHLSIGNYKFGEHSHFWFDTDFELKLTDDGFQFEVANNLYNLESINEGDPDPFLYPSLNKEGQPIYRIGQLYQTEPAKITLTAMDAKGGEHKFKINLQLSEFDHYSDEIFKEDVIGGIAVVRVRSFSDIHGDQLSQFVETARTHQGNPVLIVDIRGNSGGNESWPSSWVQQLTGQRPESILIFSELESKTSLIGRANAFTYWDNQVDDPSLFREDFEKYTRLAESIESGPRKPHWTNTRYPQIPLIANDITVVLIINDQVASAGEGFAMRLSQAENVVIVGENSMGALTFGNISTHQLPNSKVMVWLPINLNLFTDLETREGVGITPDLWVPAADAVNYAVAAIRQGTITTYQPLSQEILDSKFIPESSFREFLSKGPNFWIVIVVFVVSGSVWAYFMRKKPRILLSVGIVWLMFSLCQAP